MSTPLRYQVTDMVWLQNHGHLAEFGYGKYLIVPFWYALVANHAHLLLPTMGILAKLHERLTKVWGMAQPKSADMPLKWTNMVQYGI